MAHEKQFQDLLYDALKLNAVQLSADDTDRIGTYYLLTRKWGDKINITSNLSAEKFITENVLDPWLAAQTFQASPLCPQRTDWSLMDVGCGGAFVGVFWQMYFSPGIGETILVDSDRRKINFCRAVLRSLKLDKMTTILGRSEQIINTADVVVSRATWPPNKFRTECRRLVNPGGVMVHFTALRNTAPDDSTITSLDYVIQPGGIRRALSVAMQQTA